MRSVERVLGLLSVVLLAAAPLLVFPAGQASAQPQATQQSSRTGAAVSNPLAISITGMSPQVATPKTTVTIHGTLANHTGSAVSGIVVQAETSATNFLTRSGMDSFTTSGTFGGSMMPAGTAPPVSVPNGATVKWSVSFAARSFYSGQYVSVYPVTVVAGPPANSSQAAARTLLPYWPGKTGTTRLQVSWVWPLTNPPQQGACTHTLPSTGLDGLVSPGGRLSSLLDAGAQYTDEDHLTWDVNPSLLSDVSVMTRPGGYFTGGSAACSGRFTQKPSPAAVSWLKKLGETTADQEVFLTSYADVDVAALSHHGLDASIRSAYQIARATASSVLPHTFGAKGAGSTGGTVLRAAWPAGGQADAETVTSLASDGGVGTVVLASGQAQSAKGHDDALSRTMSGIGKSVNVLLADSEITRLLGSATRTGTAKDQYSLVQDFLAQTAMIASEYPTQARSIVVAPPSDWDPSASEAKALLSLTREPWLKPAGLSTLATEAAKGPATHLAAKRVSPDELSASYLGQVREAGDSLSVFKNLLYQPAAATVNPLNAAAAALESSAWRGPGQDSGFQPLNGLKIYLRDSEHAVQIIASDKILLTGTSGQTPVSVVNGLNLPIQVQVTVRLPPGSQLQVGQYKSLLKVNPKGTGTVRVPLHSATIGTTTVQLQLVTQNGSPLAWTVHSLSVEVTRFGRSLLIIIGGALGILVLTSAYRLRRKRRARARTDSTASKTVSTDSTGDTTTVGGTG